MATILPSSNQKWLSLKIHQVWMFFPIYKTSIVCRLSHFSQIFPNFPMKSVGCSQPATLDTAPGRSRYGSSAHRGSRCCNSAESYLGTTRWLGGSERAKKMGRSSLMIVIPSPVHTKHHLNDPNCVEIPDKKNMGSKGVFSIRGMGLDIMMNNVISINISS